MAFDMGEHQLLVRQHIQDHNTAQSERNYWGYPSRVVPCTNDNGTCEYLDAVYWMHTVSMRYTFILWAVIGGMLLIIILARLFKPQGSCQRNVRQHFPYKLWKTISTAGRRYLLPESLPNFFPNTTRLQILVLATLCVYLTVFSFIGIVYKTWITPVKNSDKHNTRTGLGGFSDRLGALAYALTPLTIGLSTRDSILSLLTGIPYQHFNFLHRWTGRIILLQSLIHTIGWTIIEGRLYQPQPKVYNTFIKQTYMIWGVVAQGFLAFLFVFSFRPIIRLTGYEFFRKSHLVVAGLYLGACWGHWSKLACWMIASLGLLGIDLGLRIARICVIHLGYKNGNRGLGFRAIKSKVQVFNDPSGTVMRLTFTHNHEPWKIGQHYYLTFPALSIWQAHPFTPASVPPSALVPPSHTYIIRARNGETKRLAALPSNASPHSTQSFETSVILTGPYGRSVIDRDVPNILAIAGGTGISFVLPIVTAAAADPTLAAQNIELIWIVRHVQNLAWIAPELGALRGQLDLASSSNATIDSIEEIKATGIVAAKPLSRLRIRIFVTRSEEKDAHLLSAALVASSPQEHQFHTLITPHPHFSVAYLNHEHPCILTLLDEFLDGTVSSGRSQVVGSGPAALGADIRAAVAARNSPSKAWKGDERTDMQCVWDDRMG